MPENKKHADLAEKRAKFYIPRVNFVSKSGRIPSAIRPTPGTTGSGKTPSEKNKR